VGEDDLRGYREAAKGVTMDEEKRTLPKSFWFATGSLVPMLVGAFGPWVTVAGIVTIEGTDGGRDGWLVVGAAAIAAVALVLYIRSRRRWVIALPLLAGLAGAATTGYDISDINGVASGNGLLGGLVNTEWGIYLALVGSISLALATVALVIEGGRKKTMPAELAAGA
jgi:uncharacterized membrane protein (UPF0136 family)